MNKHIQHLFLFEKLDIQTKLSKKAIHRRVRDFVEFESDDYYGKISDDGFSVFEKSIKRFWWGHTKNSFAPMAKAKIDEKDGYTTVSVVFRMHPIIIVLFVPMYILFVLTVILLPLLLGLLYVFFFRRIKKLKGILEELLSEK